MAQFIPSLDKISQFTVQPEPGEWALLRCLAQTLDDSFEVYFNPFLNGDRPDIIIMKKGCGVMIIEVKDWNLDLYELDDKKHWCLKYPKNAKERCVNIKSPIEQVLKYKENLYNLHIEQLLEQNIKNPKLWGVVTCGVYFHNATHKQVYDFLVNPYKNDRKYGKYISKIKLLGADDLEKDARNKILDKYLLEGSSRLFTDEIYNSIHRFLLPPIHTREKGMLIHRYDARFKKQFPQQMMFSKKQDELIFDKDRRLQWRVKGVVGAGKTTLLAAKAVQSYKELVEQGIETPKILILTFNITLKNFIHDKISQMREEFNWKSFTILNYHQFINVQLNNLCIPFKRVANESDEEFYARYYDNYSLFAERKSSTERFDVIFIDEIQDYKRVWMDIIKDCFLFENGEYPRSGYYLLGDVKQNIYNRGVAEKDVVTNVLGVNTLDTCFRSNMKVKDLALAFQQQYFEGKYEIDATLTSEQDSLFVGENLQQGYLEYRYLQDMDPVRAVYDIIEDIIEKKVNNVAINDITVLGVELGFLKLFDTFYRYRTQQRTTTMFETYELMFLQGIRWVMPQNLKELLKNLIKIYRTENKEDKQQIVEKRLATLLSIYEMYCLYPKIFRALLELSCKKCGCGFDDFLATMSHNRETYESFRDQVHSLDYKYIRDNKKYNFWMNTGCLKISSIHSFKGWESDTVFLILPNKRDYDTSFDELLYTGLTRTRSNLVVINLGNVEYHENMKQLIEKFK